MPIHIHIDNVYIADEGNSRIRKVTASLATSTPRYQLMLIKSLLSSILYQLVHLLTFSISTSPTLVPSTSTPTTPTPSSSYPSQSPSTVGIITTIAGSSTSASYSGDNSQATAATLFNPLGIRVDASGKGLTIYLSMELLTNSLPRQLIYR